MSFVVVEVVFKRTWMILKRPVNGNTNCMNKVYLTRRNLLTLLNKLDRAAKGDSSSYCTIIKRDTVHPKFPASARTLVTAVEDEDYYTDREAGPVVATDEPEKD